MLSMLNFGLALVQSKCMILNVQQKSSLYVYYRSVYTIQSHAALSTWLVYKEMRLGNYTLESFPYSSLCNSDIYFVPLNVERCNLFLYRFIAKLVLGFRRNLKSLRWLER